MLYAGFLLGLFFKPEDRDDIFLQNFSGFLKAYLALYSRS
jgi:hypothetical protein